MNQEKRVTLKPNREKSVKNRHPWIFSGAIASSSPFQNGDILPVYSHQGEFLAQAYFHEKNSISGRILSFTEEAIDISIQKNIENAIAFRKTLFDPAITNCYRLINAEGDGLSGLIVDIYDDVAVMQISTHGMEKKKSLILEILTTKLSLRGIYEKSKSGARRQEGLEDSVGSVFGECPQDVVVKENHLLFLVDIQEGQKTGFFLDQREMRKLVGSLSKNRRVLNCFSYSGGFSLFAMQGGALSITSVDSSKKACHQARENTLLNRMSIDQHSIICDDVFDYLQQKDLPFDLVILDPPAFAKKRLDIQEACRGYKEINRKAMEKMPKGSYLLTSSCSHFIDTTLFQQVLFQAAIEAGREATICSHHIQALDHPVSLFHKEGSYLKSLLLYIR